jgi:glycosyltransferase involved in cell wall biosynthesis
MDLDRRRMRLLYIVPEPWPTHRPDIAVLFGKCLPLRGVECDLVTDIHCASEEWLAGKSIFYRAPSNRALYHFSKLWHTCRSLMACKRSEYNAIQVRDMPVHALIAWGFARLKGMQFYYWMSFPRAEGQVLRARSRGWRAGLRYWFPLIQGSVGTFLLYRVVMRHADHVFVQSEYMAADVSKHGIPRRSLTAVPMGVDTGSADPARIPMSENPDFVGRRIVVYIGTLDRERRIEVLLEMVVLVREKEPRLLLIIVGDTVDLQQRAHLYERANALGITDAIMWTGWVPTNQAWRYVRAAEIGLSPIPRGFLFDCSSPTKAVEYLALEVPVLCNDNPDQATLVQESGAGVCVELSGIAFANALLEMLEDPERLLLMGRRGREFIVKTRSYDLLANKVATVYDSELASNPRNRTWS